MDASFTFAHDVGDIKMHHSFNGVVPIARGWFPANGTQLTQASYDSLHGTGAYLADGVNHSPLLSKYMPNFTGRMPVGAASTTETGSTNADMRVGNANYTYNISHTHSVLGHIHRWYKKFAGPDQSWDSSGNPQALTQNTDTDYAIALNFATTGLDNDRYTEANITQTTTNALSSVSIQPPSIEVIFYVRVV